MSRRRDDDRGDVTTQLVVLAPVVLVLLMLCVQLGLWLHAANVGAAAASRGAAAAAAAGGSAGDGVAAATAFVAEAGSTLAGAPSVQRAGDRVVVEVEVALPRLLPGLPRTVSRVAVSPVERFVPEPSR